MNSVTITVIDSAKGLRFANNSTLAVEAMDYYILAANGERVAHVVRGDLCAPLLQPGQSFDEASYVPAKNGQGEDISLDGISVEIDGIAFGDGSIEGPNSCSIESYVRIRDQIKRGGPVYPSNAPWGSRCDTMLEVRPLLLHYKFLHPDNPEPVVIQEGQNQNTTGGS